MNLVRSYYFIGKQQFKKTDKATHFGNFSLNKTSVQESKHAQCPFLLRKGAYLFFFFFGNYLPSATRQVSYRKFRSKAWKLHSDSNPLYSSH